MSQVTQTDPVNVYSVCELLTINLTLVICRYDVKRPEVGKSTKWELKNDGNGNEMRSAKRSSTARVIFLWSADTRGSR